MHAANLYHPFLVTSVLLVGLLSIPAPAAAYVGPGAGFAFVSSLFILLLIVNFHQVHIPQPRGIPCCLQTQ